jgi:hypothetical protein
MSDHDDANLKQFRSRAQQYQNAVPGAARAQTGASSTAAPVNVFVVFDSSLGGVSSEVDATRFRYTGTSQDQTTYEKMCARRMGQESMYARFY